VKALPEDFEAGALVDFLADGWGFDVEAADYVAVGAGSYHWVVKDVEGMRRFVTVDDLDRKPWLGDTRESVFGGLRRAFDTAVALREGGLGFVVAPISTSRGETVRRIGPRHTIALFPFLDGQAGRNGHPWPRPFPHHETADERIAVVSMLAELHEATPAVRSVARKIDLGLQGRRQLDSGLQEVDRTWVGGPFSEPARRALAGRASEVGELLALADRLSVDVARRSTSWVVTHGEPHARNVMRIDGSPMLIDWDTVALAPPERDLWMLMSEITDEATTYTNATGHDLDQVAANFFRLAWDLGDLAAYLDVLRSPHRETEDTVTAYDRLTKCVTIRDRWAAQLG
jgi:spectinomycin phosphotransferase